MFDRNENYDPVKASRHLAHKSQGYVNKKRKEKGEEPIEVFPKQYWKFPEDPTTLRTFLIYDELEKVKKLSAPDLLLYFFKNMLIYECNLMFNANLLLGYYYHTVKVSVKDFRRFLPRYDISKIKDCERVKNDLFFDLDLEKIISLNKKYQAKEYNDENFKSRQYIIFSYWVIKAAFDNLSVKCKDFMLFIISMYHFGKEPKIMYSLKRILKESNITMHEGRQKALDRLNKYFELFYRFQIIDYNFMGYNFKLEDLQYNKPLDIQLLRIDPYDPLSFGEYCDDDY